MRARDGRVFDCEWQCRLVHAQRSRYPAAAGVSYRPRTSVSKSTCRGGNMLLLLTSYYYQYVCGMVVFVMPMAAILCVEFPTRREVLPGGERQGGGTRQGTCVCARITQSSKATPREREPLRCERNSTRSQQPGKKTTKRREEKKERERGRESKACLIEDASEQRGMQDPKKGGRASERALSLVSCFAGSLLKSRPLGWLAGLLDCDIRRGNGKKKTGRGERQASRG